jgi:hypothetical protein
LWTCEPRLVLGGELFVASVLELSTVLRLLLLAM